MCKSTPKVCAIDRLLGNMRRKPKHQQAVRTTMTFPPAIWELGRKRMSALGYGDFCGYVHELIRVDAGQSIKITIAPKDPATKTAA